MFLIVMFFLFFEVKLGTKNLTGPYKVINLDLAL